MRRLERWGKILGLAATLAYSQDGLTATVVVNDVPAGQTVTVAAGDELSLLGNVYGSLNLYGWMPAGGMVFQVAGTFNNHGLIIATDGSFSFGTSKKVINHADGQIYVFGYMDIYDPGALFENAGLMIFGSNLSNNISGTPEITLMMRGTFKNTGTLIFDRQSQGRNSCSQGSGVRFPGYIVNEGRFQVESSTLCDFNPNRNPVGVGGLLSYTQNAGETKVNGTFGADEITINKGMLSGNGTIKGNFLNQPLAAGVTIAPGAAIGTLSIVPDEGYSKCNRCSVDIELAGNTQFDQLHVDGEFYMFNGWKLNVLLRDGYVPAPGSRFSIVTSSTLLKSSAPISNLPTLPNGRTWSVQNTGTEMILTAN